MSSFNNDDELCAPDAPYGVRDPRDQADRKGAKRKAGAPAPSMAPGGGLVPNAGLQAMTEVTGQALKRLLYSLMMTQGDHPYTSIAQTMPGSDINTTDRYIELWKNNLGRIVCVRVALDQATNAGCGIKLSLGNELSDQNKIDALSTNGTVNSQWILLRPNATLWVNTSDKNLTVSGAIIRVLLFDPESVFPGVSP